MGSWTTVRVERDDGIAWVELNRPEKRNAMSPQLNAEMVEVLLELDADDACGVLVLTGAGESFSAGMDLKEYFRDVDGQPDHVQRQVRRDSNYWQWNLEVAAIVVSDGAGAEELKAFARERVAAYKYPRLVEVVDELPHGPTGKIDRRAIDRDALASKL